MKKHESHMHHNQPPMMHESTSAKVGDGSFKGHKVPHAGHGLHPEHEMLHQDHFHKNEKHG